MPSSRVHPFVNDYVYHIFNRGVDKRKIFLSPRDYRRFLIAAEYYQYASRPLRLSHFLSLTAETQAAIILSLRDTPKQISILAYCLMPNHFHFLIVQHQDGAIRDFMSELANSYTRYFNTKHDRTGRLFSGVFRSVPITNDEQAIHTSRYIHLNPVVASLCTIDELPTYPWTSYNIYLEQRVTPLVSFDTITTYLILPPDYQQFVHDQKDYARRLNSVSHVDKWEK